MNPNSLMLMLLCVTPNIEKLKPGGEIEPEADPVDENVTVLAVAVVRGAKDSVPDETL